MCGIIGTLSASRDQFPEVGLEAMARAIHHRGPDHTGFHRDPECALGMARLSIVDLAGGNQPIYNDDRSLVIVYNGEIYNHADIRAELQDLGRTFQSHSDTETVLRAFEEWGPDCLLRFNGMFAFAIWNRKSKRLFLARDRLGIKPLYLLQDQRGIAFASEAKALLPLLTGAPQPDWSGIAQYFSAGYLPSPRSPFAGIRKMAPGHYAWCDAGRMDETCWWRPRYGLGEDRNPVEAAERLEELMDRAVRLELMSDVPLGVFLSGGLDSSAVAHYAVKNARGPMHSFALSFTESTHDESADARLVADHLGTIHHTLTFTPDLLREYFGKTVRILDEPFGDSTVVPLLALSEFAREKVKVALTGWGGDEIFAGYPTYKAHQMAALYRKLPGFIAHGLIPAAVNWLPVSDKYMSLEFKAKRFIRGMDLSPDLQHFVWMGYFGFAEVSGLFKPEVTAQVEEELPAVVERAAVGLEEQDVVSRALALDARFFMEGNGLFQADRMTMAASLEARVPLLNIDLLDYVNPLPTSLKMPRGVPKGLLKSVLRPHLPPAIINKPKKGFGPPSNAWVRGAFKETIEAMFQRDRVEAQGIFQYSTLSRLLEEHFQRKQDHGRVLWSLLSFQMWHERFIGNRIGTDA